MVQNFWTMLEIFYIYKTASCLLISLLVIKIVILSSSQCKTIDVNQIKNVPFNKQHNQPEKVFPVFLAHCFSLGVRLLQILKKCGSKFWLFLDYTRAFGH